MGQVGEQIRALQLKQHFHKHHSIAGELTSINLTYTWKWGICSGITVKTVQ